MHRNKEGKKSYFTRCGVTQNGIVGRTTLHFVERERDAKDKNKLNFFGRHVSKWNETTKALNVIAKYFTLI